jgi:hypothetical protein
VGAAPVRERVLSGFAAGTAGWLPAENANAVTTAPVPGYGDGRALVVHFDDPSALPFWSQEAKTAKGADVVFRHPVQAAAMPWLNLAVRVPSPSPGGLAADGVLHAIVKVYGADGHVAEGIARVTPGTGWLPLSVDLASWPEIRSITRVKVWVQGSTDQTWLGSYDIGRVSLSARVPASALTNLDITATAARHSPAAGTGVTLKVTNDDTAALSGTLAVGTCPDVTVTPGSVSLAGLAPGATRTFTVTLTAYQPAASPALCLSYRGESFRVPLALPPPAPHTLYDFSSGTQGWQPARNVASAATVTSFANGPGVPYGGGYALDATADAVPASALKSVSVTPSAPLDLSSAGTFFAYLDCYGGAPGATGYQAVITLTGGGGHTLIQTVPIQHDSWNQVSADVSSWPYRDDITDVEIGFQAVGSTAIWAPHFQLDDVGYTS